MSADRHVEFLGPTFALAYFWCGHTVDADRSTVRACGDLTSESLLGRDAELKQRYLG